MTRIEKLLAEFIANTRRPNGQEVRDFTAGQILHLADFLSVVADEDRNRVNVFERDTWLGLVADRSEAFGKTTCEGEGLGKFPN